MLVKALHLRHSISNMQTADRSYSMTLAGVFSCLERIKISWFLSFKKFINFSCQIKVLIGEAACIMRR